MNRVLEVWREIGQESLNLPNLLTLIRILLIPVFIVLFITPTPERSLIAAVIFTIAAMTDMLDGYIARRTGQVTKLGKLLDPIADKPEFTIDLESQTLSFETGSVQFPIDPFNRTCLLNGVDELGYIMEFKKEITEFEARM